MKITNSIRFFSSRNSRPPSISFAQRSTSFISSFLSPVLVVFALCFGALSNASAATIFVNVNSPTPSNGDGASWSTALTTIQAALNAATAAATQSPGAAIDIWIAGGTYPLTYCNRPLPNNANIYGGFAGTETQISERLFTGNLPTIQTVLTEPPYSSCYLFKLAGTTNTLNGITLMANGGILQSGGSLTAVNSTFTGNPAGYGVVGGGGINAHNGATLLVDNSLFTNLKAAVGGAIAGLNAASVTVTNSIFSGNRALGVSYSNPVTQASVFHTGGGAINVDGNFSFYYYDYGTPVNNTQVKLHRNTFINNSQIGFTGGGAIHVEDADNVAITNSTFGALDSNGLPIFSSRNISSYNYGGANGGAISLSSSQRVTVDLNNFYGNVASLQGGAIHSRAHNLESFVSITFNKFIQNSALFGGAIADVNEQGSNGLETVSLNISSNIFSGNTVSGGTDSKGPAIYYDMTQAKINDKNVVPAINKALTTSNPTLLPSDIWPLK